MRAAVALTGTIAAIIAIVQFTTGWQSLKDALQRPSNTAVPNISSLPDVQVPDEPVPTPYSPRTKPTDTVPPLKITLAGK
jgi:hypothetical protein